MQKHIQQLNWRAAIKKFDSTKKLSEEQLNLLIESARLAPTSYGVQPFKLVVVKDQNVKQSLREASYGQAQLTDSDIVFAFCIRTDFDKDLIEEYLDRIKEAHNVTDEHVERFRQTLLGSVDKRSKEEKSVWATKQAYIALGFVLDAAAQNNIDSCPMEGFDANKFDEILGLAEKNLHSVVIVTLGFRSEDDDYSNMPKVRISKDDFIINK